MRILNALSVWNQCDRFIFCINIIILVCNRYFTCQNFYIVILSYPCFLIFFANRYTVCFRFQIIIILFLDFIKFVNNFCSISLILSLNCFCFFGTFLDFRLLFFHKLIYQRQAHIKLLLCSKMLLLSNRTIAWQVPYIICCSIST